ncbi:MAG: ABC transporter permease [Mailhella sp.]|nr:ABC transporter permease [Mailhella sp.]
MTALFRYGWAFFAIGGVWQALSLLLGEFVLPRPFMVLAAFSEAVCDTGFLAHAGESAWRVCTGLCLAWAFGFPMGILLGCRRKLDAMMAPIVFLTYPVPKIVFLPVFFSLFGLGDLPRSVLIALTVGYQILVVTRASVLNLDPKYLDSFLSLGGSRKDLMRHVLIPAALPDAVTALRVASGTAVAVLFMAESFATRKGLGFLIMDAWGRGDQIEMFTGIMAMSLVGLCLYGLSNLLERFLCPWKSHPAENDLVFKES